MQTKNLTIKEMDESGKGLALLARLSEVDHDGDTYQPGAFSWKGGSQWAPLLTAHDRWGMPFGKARVYEEGNAAYAELHLNLDSQAGKEWHAALKFDLSTGKSVQEWSYGFETIDADYQVRGEDRVRVLKRLDVHEVSTVVRGAGIGTGTIAMKGLKAALKEGRFEELVDGLGTMADMLRGNPELLSATGRKQLGEIHAALGAALVDPAEAAAAATKAIEHELARHLTRDARLKQR